MADKDLDLPNTEDAQLRPLSILIIGGGVGGLSAAIALRQNGHHVTVRPPFPDNKPFQRCLLTTD
jgi:2-polyprenyl-6-methoxyphenol hydroxylase-like FAD-dependent oxidoreductase